MAPVCGHLTWVPSQGLPWEAWAWPRGGGVGRRPEPCPPREIRNVELLKLRFGEAPMHFCEVMLKVGAVPSPASPPRPPGLW